MPLVNGKHFPYTKAGYKAAAKAKMNNSKGIPSLAGTIKQMMSKRKMLANASKKKAKR